jgi:hypothetical protein
MYIMIMKCKGLFVLSADFEMQLVDCRFLNAGKSI